MCIVRDWIEGWLLWKRRKTLLSKVLVWILDRCVALYQLRWRYEFDIWHQWVLILRQNCRQLHHDFGRFLNISFFVIYLLNPSPDLLDERFVDVALPLCVEVVILRVLDLKLAFPLLKLKFIQPNLRFKETQVTRSKDPLHLLLLQRVFVKIWKVAFADFFVFDQRSWLFYYNWSVDKRGVLRRCGCIGKCLKWWASYKTLPFVFNSGLLFWRCFFLIWAWQYRYSLRSWLYPMTCFTIVILLINMFFADDLITVTTFHDFFIIAYGIIRLVVWTMTVFNSFPNFSDQETFLVALLTELLAWFFVFFTLYLNFHMTHNDPLDFWGGITVFLAQAGFLGTVSPNLFCEFCLSVSHIKFVRMCSSMHHKLLVLVVVRFGDQVSYNMRVLGQKGFVVNFFPLESLAKLCSLDLGGFHLFFIKGLR